MLEGISRRKLLCGLFAAPAVVAIGSLMPLRGVKFDPIMRIQSWPFGELPCGTHRAFEGKLSSLMYDAELADITSRGRKAYIRPWDDCCEEYPIGGWATSNNDICRSSVFDAPSEEERAEHSRNAREKIRKRLISAESIQDTAWRDYRFEDVVVPAHNPVEYDKSTEALISGLNKLCQWGA